MTAPYRLDALSKILALTLLASELLVGVKADHCWTDNNGFEHCSSLSNGARIGIGIGIAVLFLILTLLALMVARRRRLANNRLFLMQQQQQPQQYDPQYGGAYGAPQDYQYRANNAQFGQSYNQPQYPSPEGPPPPGYNVQAPAAAHKV